MNPGRLNSFAQLAWGLLVPDILSWDVALELRS
jgi:hypothetical protein